MCSYVIVTCHSFFVVYLYNVDDTFLSIIGLTGFDTGILRNHALSVFQQQLVILLKQGVTVPRQLGKYTCSTCVGKGLLKVPIIETPFGQLMCRFEAHTVSYYTQRLSNLE